MARNYYSNDLYDRIDFSDAIEIADAISGGNVGSIGIIRKAAAFRVGDNIEIQIDIRNLDTTGMTAGNALYIRGIPFTPESDDIAIGAVHVNPTTYTTIPVVYQIAGEHSVRLVNCVGTAAVTVGTLTSGVSDIVSTWSFAADTSDF